MRTLKNELFTAMQQWLAEFDSLKVLGYKHDTKAGERARNKFCNAKHLLHFLYGFRDDGVFNASGLFWRVADLAQQDLQEDFLNLEQSDFEKLLQTHQAWLESYKLLQASKIAIRTDFTRTDIASFVIEMSRYEQFCKIALRFESALLSQDEIIAQVRETILEHFKEHKGRLHIFGEILGYCFIYGGSRLEFNTQGEMIANPQGLVYGLDSQIAKIDIINKQEVANGKAMCF